MEPYGVSGGLLALKILWKERFVSYESFYPNPKHRAFLASVHAIH